MPSACYVYAIVGRDTSLPAAGTRGARADAELAMVRCRELGAVTARVVSDSAPLTPEAVLHHEAVVEAVRRQGPALPVRFGTVFRDETSLASALAARYEPLAADLDRLGDKVELSLTALWAAPSSGAGPAPASRDDDAAGAPGAGARYLHARAAELRRGDALAERARGVARELDQALRELALDRRVSPAPTPRVAVRATYLLDPAGVGAFRAAVEASRPASDEVRVLLTGPWPPYSFVSRSQTEGGAAWGGRVTGLAQLLNDVMRGRPG